MFPRPLVLLAVLSLLYSSSAHVFIRQDDPAASDTGAAASPTDDGSGDASASPAASPEPSADSSADAASPSPTDASAAIPSASGSTTGGVSSLGGAGTGGAYPEACSSCANTFSLIQ